MRSLIVLSFALVGLTFIASAEGLQCYDCTFTDADGTKLGEESCKSGKTPESKLAGECIPRTGYKTMCAKATVEVKADGKKEKTTKRGCVGIPTNDDTSARCDDEIKGVWLTSSAKNGSSRADVSMKGNVCVCDTDKCNSSSFVKISSGLILLSAILAIFRP